MFTGNTRIRRLLAALLGLSFLLVTLSRRRPISRWRGRQIPPPTKHVEKGIVMAKQGKDNVKWALNLWPDWYPYIYTSADPPEPGYLRLPSYRGRESVTYLTFIIDHYNALPSTVAFLHAAENQWHNDILGASNAILLQNLRIDTIQRLGFANLRCTQQPGCPVAVSPLAPTKIDIEKKDMRAYFADIYMELFNVPPSKVPAKIGNVCCAQFAVSAERIRQRPRSDYVRMRKWAMEGNATDSFGTGWVFEQLWHIVFGMEPINCPTFKQCRCDLFGWCGTIPEKYKDIVRSAHPWLGSRLGNTLGNANAVGSWDD